MKDSTVEKIKSENNESVCEHNWVCSGKTERHCTKCGEYQQLINGEWKTVDLQ